MLTHRAKYALKALLHLARNGGHGPIQAHVIATAENISLKFLELILVQLRSSGLIRSRVGKNGGHELNRPPDEISLLLVVRTTDGPIAPLPCLSHTAYARCEDCEDESTCGARAMLVGVHRASLDLMAKTTLADALGMERKALAAKLRSARKPRA